VDQFPGPDEMFGAKGALPYKKTVIAPIEGVLDCECTVFEPLEEPEKKLMFIYVHGGGMAIFDGKGCLEFTPANYAIKGHIGATVHFTNSTEECYPRGRNDVISAVKYLSTTYREKVKGICLYGDSGGANLVISSMLKMKQEEPDKDYVECLYIESPYLYPIKAIPEETFATPADIKGSLDENSEEYNMTTQHYMRGQFLCYKGPDRDELEFLQDKFAFPYFATEDDYKNFPVTYVQSNECDMLRDVGLRLYRQLIGAGVKAFHAVEAGTFHCGERMDMMYASMIDKRREAFLSCVLEQRQNAAAAAAEE